MSLLALLGLASIAVTVVFTMAAFFGAGATAGAGQTRRGAIIEVWANILIGFGINYAANLAVLPLVGARMSLADNLWVGSIFTAISVVRSFVVRRHFERHIHRACMALAAGK